MPMRRKDYPDWWDVFSWERRHEVGACEWCGRVLNEIRQTPKCDRYEEPLTIAHLDHDRTNNALANLAVLCTKCHLRHDQKQHAKNAAETRRRKLEANGNQPLPGCAA